MSGAGQRLAKLSDRFYDRMRDPGAFAAAQREPTAQGFGSLRGGKYCLLVTFRRSGDAVPTPVWFGLDDEGRLYVRTESDAGKVKRIRRDARAHVARASFRGGPTGPLAAGAARVMAPSENERAERALRANYGLGRRLYEGLSGPLGVETVYLEVTPSGP